jgi:hypothetical protein
MVRIKMGGYVDDDGKIMTESYKQVWEKKVATRTKEITRLEAENARLREALEDIVHCIYGNEATFQWVEKKAREALKGEK